MYLQGQIIEEQKNYYLVDTPEGVIKSFFKGTIKKQKNKIVVGDFVEIEVYNREPEEAIIRDIRKRDNFLHKPAIANIEQILIILTFKEPLFSSSFLDRLLFTSGVLDYPVILVFNKYDVLNCNELEDLNKIVTYYQKTGYDTITVSANTGWNMDIFVNKISNKLSILSGQSGTGKSTLLSKIFPEREFRINRLSYIQRGVHTTTSTTLLKLPEGGYIADAPGFSCIDLPDVNENEVSSYFPEIAKNEGNCKFYNCIHKNEPGCFIKQLVENGEISQNRYNNYIIIYDNIREDRRNYSKSQDTILNMLM